MLRTFRCLILAGFMTLTLTAGELTVPELVAGSRFLVIGHRGYKAAAPENTLPSYLLALEAKADLVELDYWPSRDGVLVVCHDQVLDRTTNATTVFGRKEVRISELTAKEITALDAGAWFNPKFADTHVPLLTEALEAIRSRGGVTLIHHKAGPAAGADALLRSLGLVNHVVVQSFDWNYLRALHALLPEQVLGALGPLDYRGGKKMSEEEKWLNAAWLDTLADTGVKVVVWDDQIDRAGVDEAHRRGLKVWVYADDRPEVTQRLLAAGIDGLITNDPKYAQGMLAKRATP